MAQMSFSLLPDADVRRISEQLLQERFNKYGFSSLDLRRETDFDDQIVFRINLKLNRSVPTKEIISALGSLHQTLRENGEDRFVYLDVHTPEDVTRLGKGSISEDVE